MSCKRILDGNSRVYVDECRKKREKQDRKGNIKIDTEDKVETFEDEIKRLVCYLI